MKINHSQKHLLFSGMAILLLATGFGCKKDEDEKKLATVATVSVSDITQTTAKVISRVSDEGGALVTGTGVCWSKTTIPTLSNNFSNVGQGTGDFISILTGLDTNATYYVRAYANNEVGTAYGNTITFSTLP